MKIMTELLRASIAIVLLTLASAEYNVQEHCNVIAPGTKLPSLDSCQVFYTCNGYNVKFKTSYCQDDEVFSKDAQSCVPPSEGSCYYDLSNPCNNKNDEFAYCSRGCNWYNYCINNQIAWNKTCLEGQVFHAPTGSCVNGNCGGSSYIENVCDIMPTGVYFGDTNNCRNYYICTGVSQRSGQCTGNLVLDVNTGQCLEAKGDMCIRCNNVIGDQVGGPPEQPCTSTSQIVADVLKCSMYYACEPVPGAPANTFQWVPKDCVNQYFDVIAKTCTNIFSARVFPSCNRCQLNPIYSRTYWVNAVDPRCEQYLTCEKGMAIGNGVCNADAFFDQKAQGCNEALDKVQQYVKNNGACQNYACNDDRECSMAGTVPAGDGSNGNSNGNSNGEPNGNSNGETNGESNGETNGESNGASNGESNGESNGKKIVPPAH